MGNLIHVHLAPVPLNRHPVKLLVKGGAVGVWFDPFTRLLFFCCWLQVRVPFHITLLLVLLRVWLFLNLPYCP